jgi:cytoskeletal protein RodZ
MTMDSFFSRLKRAREAKHLTLSDISDATSINVKFLEAIEQGQTTVLPEPYIRAFIREYARVIGLDPEETLREYDEASRPPAPTESEKIQPDVTPEVAPPPPSEEATRGGGPSPRLALVAIIIIVLTALTIVLWNLWRSPSGEMAIRAPALDSVKVSEPALSGADGRVQPSPPFQGKHSTLDSLTLTAKAVDSVWILIRRDQLPPDDVILRAGHQLSWKARDRFLLTVGNAGGVLVTFSGTQIGTLGRRGAVVRDREFNRQSLAHK